MSRLSVKTLLCHAHVPMALKCLASLVRSSRESVELVIHDDGSLTGPDLDALREKLPVAAVVTRAEADERMRSLLARHPACARFRDFEFSDRNRWKRLADLSPTA